MVALRAFAAFLAGTNRMLWPHFLVFHALGGRVWAALYGMGAYLLDNNIHRFTGLVGRITLVLSVLLSLVLLVVVRRNEHRLEEEVLRALPDSLDAY